MATANEVIKRAYRLAGIGDIYNDPSSALANDGLNALNELLDDWDVSNVLDGGSVAALTTTLPFKDGYIRAIKYNLAVALASQHESHVDPVVFDTAELLRGKLISAIVSDFRLEAPADLPGLRGNAGINE